MYIFQTSESKTQNWVCPLNCGCTIKLEKVIIHVDRELLRMYLLQNPEVQIPEEDKRTQFLTPVGVEFLGKGPCAEHATLYDTPDAMYQDLKHLHQFLVEPVHTCSCAYVFFRDERLPKEQQSKIGTHDPLLTKKCERHAHITDAQKHLEIVDKENEMLGLTMKAIQESLSPAQLQLAEPFLTNFSLVPKEWEQESPDKPHKMTVSLPGVTLSKNNKDAIRARVLELKGDRTPSEIK